MKTKNEKNLGMTIENILIFEAVILLENVIFAKSEKFLQL